jgi:hypothetical protein
MNNAIYVDRSVGDEARRRRLFDGQLVAYSPRASSLALADFTRQMVEGAFAPLDPRTAQHAMDVERFAAVLGELKPAFIHHPAPKRLVQVLLASGVTRFSIDFRTIHLDDVVHRYDDGTGTRGDAVYHAVGT